MSESLMYVNFEEETGKILGISPKQNRTSSIPVSLSAVQPLLDGVEPKRNYRVEYNAKTKELELKHQFIASFDGSNVNDFIYEIPETGVKDPDIVIEQNISETCWKVKIGSKLKKNLQSKKIRLNQTLNFTVTKRHDPNILYKTLSVDFSSIMTDNYSVLPFSMRFEEDNTAVSVFTARTFDSYLFIRVFDE
jgi:hypothetical protein